VDSPQIDTTKPSIARVYDAGLGGKDNFEVDRAVLKGILERSPDALLAGRDNREWLIRVTRYLAGEARIDQFVDLGSGLPTSQNTHQVAQRLNAESTVVYVDNDPSVLAHGRALLAENDHTHFVAGDLTNATDLLAHPEMHRYVDFSRPVALYQIGTLHHCPDVDQIRAFMHEYVDALAPGSYVAISHFFNPGSGEDAETAAWMQEELTNGPMGSGYFRGMAEVESFFAGLELVEPGIVPAADWWPDGPKIRPLVQPQRLIVAGLAVKR
jgi:O-methyltransferase involved in polyketide biosynthesis